MGDLVSLDQEGEKSFQGRYSASVAALADVLFPGILKKTMNPRDLDFLEI